MCVCAVKNYFEWNEPNGIILRSDIFFILFKQAIYIQISER